MNINAPNSGLEMIVVTRTREIVDGFNVRRALPTARRRMVGPFIFFDQMGPEILRAGQGLDVAPHPHIGLATLTYLFKGELTHRDSLGTIQEIRAGEVNWMTAGRGIAHSERTPDAMRNGGAELFGIQSWIALPRKNEEIEPDFSHHESTELPIIEGEGKRVCLIAGSLFGVRSPVKTFSEMFYADAMLETGAQIPVSAEHEERAIYVVDGSVEISSEDGKFDAGQLLVLKPRAEITIKAASDARVMLLGGEPMDGQRHIWWNFVSSSKERIEQAKEDWRAGRFLPVPDEVEFIPLPPDLTPKPVNYP
ncbi:MAG: pirin family protein [Acidobacteriota bacterium]|nr:pirin family protein [Acidobacteriota bacterium]